MNALTDGGVPREQKMLKGHLPIVIYHEVYQYTNLRKPDERRAASTLNHTPYLEVRVEDFGCRVWESGVRDCQAPIR
jgi:hypothetical protein